MKDIRLTAKVEIDVTITTEGGAVHQIIPPKDFCFQVFEPALPPVGLRFVSDQIVKLIASTRSKEVRGWHTLAMEIGSLPRLPPDACTRFRGIVTRITPLFDSLLLEVPGCPTTGVELSFM